MADKATQLHEVERTSPKGQQFIGTCRLCGRENMTLYDAMQPDCPNLRGLSAKDAVIEAIHGPKETPGG